MHTESPDTRICFLIAAHRNPGQLGRLIEALRSDRFDLYVHVDAKSDIRPFLHPGATFIDQRVRVSWGTYSLVQATTNLLRAASETRCYKRYVLLSGQDYPLRSNRVILRELLASQEERIDCFSTDDYSWHRRYSTYWLGGRTTTHRALQRVLQSRHLAIVRELPLGYEPRWGATWWALTDDAVEYVLGTLRRQPEVASFFRFCLLPDEMLFQTLLWNSSLRERMTHGITYVDWTSSDGAHPKVLTTEDYDALVGSTALFARKFEAEAGSEILDRLDAHITHEDASPSDRVGGHVRNSASDLLPSPHTGGHQSR